MSTNPAPAPERHWASLEDVADMLGVKPRTLREWIAAGTLPAYRFGPRLIRIDLADVDALAERIPTGDIIL